MAGLLLEHIPSGADVIVAMANGEPVGLVDALEEQHARLHDVRIHQMHALHRRPCIAGAYPGRLCHVSYFLAPATREAYWSGGCDLVPNHFSEMPHLLRTETRCSIVLAAVSPPDRHGYFSLGTNAEYVAALIGRVPFFVEVNARMPRTRGGNQIHTSQVLGWTETDRPLVEVPLVHPERVIGRSPPPSWGGSRTAPQSRPGSAEYRTLLSDGIVELVERGVVTGARKRRHPNRIVTTFALGTQHLYDRLHENPAVAMLPVDYVNDPRTVARERNFVSINATTEVDLYGQCASETIAGRYWSSSGGQADFARGAMYAEGGQAFIVLHSTTSAGESRIRLHLSEGSVVTTLKNTVDHVVTEWGIAKLRGRSLADRARALIAIAHPDHRERLEREAHAAGLSGRLPALAGS
jgi:acyl-CoA hydrolase